MTLGARALCELLAEITVEAEAVPRIRDVLGRYLGILPDQFDLAGAAQFSPRVLHAVPRRKADERDAP